MLEEVARGLPARSHETIVAEKTSVGNSKWSVSVSVRVSVSVSVQWGIYNPLFLNTNFDTLQVEHIIAVQECSRTLNFES